ncbi:MAG: hypothetical protein O9318_01425 [Hylemonella sp.]|uniref:hypothetical protein n=1 Tax=Hylemonella sp. TaxID=2066020 RepID=UPI0022C7799B|nr:hypothetical protein [Hylemonella sp.]MCZ8251110.1 hypothetical protein [Hylemonella sp.]
MNLKPLLPLLLASSLACAADPDDARYAAYACQQYAMATLKTLGKPKVDGSQPAQPVDVRDARWAGKPEVWQSSGALLAQVRFGAPMVRYEYRCAVQKQSGSGWKLLELQWPNGQP